MVHPPFFFDFITPIIICLKIRFIMKLIIMQCSWVINYFLFLTPSSSHSYFILYQPLSVMQINVFTILRNSLYISPMAQKSLVGKGLLIIEASRSHSEHTTPGMTPLDEWSARHGDLYLTTHNTHNRHISMSPAGFEASVPANEQLQTHSLDLETTGIGLSYMQ